MVKNMDGVILAQGMPDSKAVDETFFMQEQEESAEYFFDLRAQSELVGDAGSSLINLMADDVAFMLPVDKMISQGITLDQVSKANFDDAAIDTPAKTSIVSCMESAGKLKGTMTRPLHPFTLARFNGAMTEKKVQEEKEKARKRRELKNGITHRASVWTPPSKKKLQEAAKPAEDEKQEDIKQEDVKQENVKPQEAKPEEDDLEGNLNINFEIQKHNIQHDLDIANGEAAEPEKAAEKAADKAAKEASDKADNDYRESLKSVSAAGKEVDPHTQKPEELLGKQIAHMNRENQKRFMKLPLAVINARTRMQANCQAKNIYPEFMEDVRTLLLAEHLKREYLCGFEMEKYGHCDTKVMFADPKNPEVSALDELMSENIPDPEAKFAEMRSSFNFGRPLQQLQASLRAHDGDVMTLNLMKGFTEKNTAAEVYDKCREHQRQTMKIRNSEIFYNSSAVTK